MSARSDLHFVRKFSTYRFITCSGARQRTSPESTFISWRNRDVPIVTHVAATWLFSFSPSHLSFLPVLNIGDNDENARDRLQLDPLIKSDDYYYVIGIEPINAGVRSSRYSLWNETSRTRNKRRCSSEILWTDVRVMPLHDIVINCFSSFFFYDLSIDIQVWTRHKFHGYLLSWVTMQHNNAKIIL